MWPSGSSRLRTRLCCDLIGVRHGKSDKDMVQWDLCSWTEAVCDLQKRVVRLVPCMADGNCMDGGARAILFMAQ